MNLEVGETVSHYKIIAHIGQGGMGIVYKAQDLKLDRPVALKFLPPELTRDPEAKERFVHEAKATSALDHNNICTVHEIGETVDGQMFIVMSCYEGETLKSRISKGRLRIEEATGLAIQIAQGLAEAHRHNIIHRDVKPANILITNSGVAKIVDFGLAKLSGATKITKTGSTLGTVAYMPPEQLRGEDVDARADIFSLGVVLYEMLTGRTPFRGEHEPALMYSIMNEEPEPLQDQVPDVPAELIHIVSRSLEKTPEDRYKSTDDLLVDLRRLRKETSRVSMHVMKGGTPRRHAPRGRAIVASVLVLAGIAATFYILNQPRRLPRLNPNRKETVLTLPVKDVSYSCLSRDGNWIAFGGMADNNSWNVYYMNSSGGNIRRVAYDSAGEPAVYDISRDGGWILYHHFHPKYSFEIAAVQPLGGMPRVLGYGLMAKFVGATDRFIYQKMGPGRKQRVKHELWSMKLDGNEDTLVFTDPGLQELAWGSSVSWSVSPDGKFIAWIKTFADFSQDLITHNLKTGAERQVTFNRTPKDEVFWTHNNFIIYSSYASGNWDLWACPEEGGESRQLTVSRLDEIQAQLSDDGRKLLFLESHTSGNIRSMDLQTGKVTSITSDDQNRGFLTTSPDGRYIAYTSMPSLEVPLVVRGIQIVDKNQERPMWSIVTEELIGYNRAWSPDGKWIAYTRRPDSVNKPFQICIVSPFDAARPRVIAEEESYHGLDRSTLRWKDEQTLSWFADRKTWVCSIENPKPQQFYQDSTDVYFIQKGKFILFTDYRVGHRGVWIDIAAIAGKAGSQSAKRISFKVLATAPSGQFMLAMSASGEIQRISLPDLKVERLLCRFPKNWADPSISQDGKSIVYLETTASSKLMLWENPFAWE